MDQTFDINEKLLRAVYPPNRKPDFWNGKRLSSAAFKDKYGLSVDRTGNRTLPESVADIRKRMSGFIVSLTVPLCTSANTHLVYKPSQGNPARNLQPNPYHSEIHSSVDTVMLSDEQALLLARGAKVEYQP